MRSLLTKQRAWLSVGICLFAIGLVDCKTASRPIPKPLSTAPPAQSAVQPAPEPNQLEDPLGRATPRGAVLGFLVAASEGKYEIAAQYLDTSLQGKPAATLAEQLFFVLDRRLPARLNNLSNDPAGSLSDALSPRHELVGTIESNDGKIDIVLEHVSRGQAKPIWLFSRQTLAATPDLYDEINAISVESFLPAYFFKRFLRFSLIGWLSFFIGLPLLYLLTILLDRLLDALAGFTLRRLRKWSEASNPRVLPPPLRLLVVALVIRCLISRISLPLISRQFWSTTTTVLTIAGGVWLAILIAKLCEVRVKTRLERRNYTGAIPLIRPLRRLVDILSLTVGLFFFLFSLGINPTAALAGLGVGGIAVALAAQKTLENVIGGASIILDKAVKVGEFLKIADLQGTVEEIGLRSTKLRTLDRTVVTIPNGQIASVTLENLSSRDRFWFHHVIGLRYETTPARLSSILEDIRTLLVQDIRVFADSARVRLFRFGPSSLDVDIYAYVVARDWTHFLEIQEELLLRIMELVGARGVKVAFPSQTVYLAHSAGDEQTANQPLRRAAPGGNTS
jgi:MscS family membrane protein